MDKHFSSQNNITYERYVFQNVQQNVDENIHQIYIRVKEQAVKYDFGATLDTEIKQQIILATGNNKLRRYCFRYQDVTRQQLLLHAKSLKNAENQAREIKKMTENIAALNLTRLHKPTKLSDEGYHYFPFDVTLLFTNVPLNKTINIILHRICKKNLSQNKHERKYLEKTD